MSHEFIWETLEAVGLPIEFINAIKMLHNDNAHCIRVQGALYDGPTVRCGVRQGCPLSGILFAICADVILVNLQSHPRGSDEIVRAFADDTAVVVEDYYTTIGLLSTIFDEYRMIFGLELNVKKACFVLLWHVFHTKNLRKLIDELTHCRRPS